MTLPAWMKRQQESAGGAPPLPVPKRRRSRSPPSRRPPYPPAQRPRRGPLGGDGYDSDASDVPRFMTRPRRNNFSRDPAPPPGAPPAGGGGGGFARPPMGLAANMQQTRQARRLYVASLPPGCNDAELTEFFVRCLSEGIGPEHANGVVHVYVKPNGAFAFVELRTMELASACLALDGIGFRGSSLKVQRPKDYNEAASPRPAGPPLTLELSRLGVVSSSVPDSAHKIFIGGLPYHLQEPEVQSLLQAFGPLRGFHLVRERGAGPTANSKGYAFAEYVDHSITHQAIAGLHGMQLGEKALTVRLAKTAASHAAGPPAPAAPAPAAPARQSLVEEQLAAAMGLGPGSISNAAGAPDEALGVGATRVVLLRNMVTEEELRDDQEYDDILLDVREECSNYGTLEEVWIPRPPHAQAGNVFLRYAAVAMAANAARRLDGRRFAGRSVGTAFLEEGAFEAMRGRQPPAAPAEAAPAGPAPAAFAF